MAAHQCKNKTTAKAYAADKRKKGFKATIYPLKGKGWGVSVTKK